MKLVSNLVLATMFLITFASCKQKIDTNDALSIIPSNTTSVTAINLKSLLQKADLEDIKKLDFYQNEVQGKLNSEPTIAAIFADPTKSGINFDQNAYLINLSAVKNNDISFNGLVFNIKDVAAFEKMLGSKNQKIEQKDGISFLKMDNNNIAAWNETKGIIGSSYDDDKYQTAAQILKTDASKSVANNEVLQKSLSEKHDIITWFSSNPLAESPEMQMSSGSLGISNADLKDNYMTGYCDFLNGEVKGKSNYHLNNNIINKFGILFKDGVKTDFSKYIPSQDASMLMTFALDSKGVKQFLVENGSLKSMVDMKLDEAGLTTDDLLAMLDGDIAITMYPTNTNDNTQSKIIALAIKDQNILKKFIDFGEKVKILTKTTEGSYNIRPELADKMPMSNRNTTTQLIVKDNIIMFAENNAGTKVANNKINENNIFATAKNNIFAISLNPKGFANFSDNIYIFKTNAIQMNTNLKGGDFLMSLEEKNKNALNTIFHNLNDAYLKDKANNKVANASNL